MSRDFTERLVERACLALDGAGREAVVAAGRARAASFTWEACAAGLAALYGRAAEASTPDR